MSSSAIPVVTSAEEMATLRATWHRAGETVALVPTMGALHDGHLALVDRAGARADRVVVSVFVNPLQFAPGEDFDRYPRSLEGDLASLDGHRVDAVFAPTVQAVYPDWPDTTATHRAGKVGEVFEGAHRPGHFDGVLTVVARLFDLVQPTLAVFGQKDAQQLFLVTQMAARRVPPGEIVAVETVRAKDGLARSSRNVYLSEAERHTATALSSALSAVKVALLGQPQSSLDKDSIERILNRAREEISRAGLTPDYLDVVSADDFSPWRGGKSSAVVAIVACPVGGVRLLDSVLVEWSGGVVV